MNTATMRRIDHLLGATMCVGLTLVRRVSDPFRPAPPERPRRILFVKLAEQGAWVVAWSALQDAVHLVGREHVMVMTFTENRFVLDQMGVLPPENIWEIRTSGPLRTALDLVRATRRARRAGVDTAIDLEFFARSSAILCFLSGAAIRVGFHRSAKEASYRGDLHTHRLSFNPRLHVGETFRLLVSAVSEDPHGLPAIGPRKLAAEAPPHGRVSHEEVEQVERLIARRVGPGRRPRLILLNANAGDLLPLRRWPEDRYVELGKRLTARYAEVVVAFTGSPSEAVDAARLARAIGSDRAVSLGGATTLRQLIVLYQMSEVLVTNDSGPAHYAALAPIDIVTLFGPESPRIFGSLSPRNRALWAELPCSPCVNAYNDRLTACADNLCMQQISVDQVFDLVCELYEARRGLPDQRLGRSS